MKKIGIIGTRGIPNQYGGFEQFAEQFSTRMVERGHQVSVYTSHRHPYKEDSYRNVKLLRCYDPEHLLGTAGQFIYDMNCIRDSRKRQFDVILQLGYTSSTIWSWLYPSSSVLVTNMDGLEWTRSKYNKPTKYFLTHAERWGVRYSDHLIADSAGIQAYLKEKYNAGSDLISYGASIYEPAKGDADSLRRFNVKPYEYDLLIARFEPENNIETILKAYKPLTERKLLLVGNHMRTVFGRRMYEQYRSAAHISFVGGIFDMDALNVLRYYSRLYLHGHSVGGTNPSLLEAMGCNALICAHDNIFNRHVLGDDAFYFKDEDDIQAIAAKDIDKTAYTAWLQNNRRKIEETYNWEKVTGQIENKLEEWGKC